MIYKIIALTILSLFYGFYFAKMFFQSKEGIKTDHLGRGKSGIIKFIEITVKLTAIICPAVEIASIVLDTAMLTKIWRNSGVCIGILGLLIFIISVLTMRENWRAGVPEKKETKLVTNGIYSISRNPAFLGFDLVYIGILLMFFNYILFAVSVFSILMFHIQIINSEEDFLITEFGKEYLNYQKHVCRYIGKK